MPLSRCPRVDRRRRAIREGLIVQGDSSDESRVSPSRTNRNSVELPELAKKDRGVAYSHSVRRTCQHRLVQFIPVRKLSLTGAVAASVSVPLLLLTLHYLVFVSGTLDWSRHPMSALLNASSPRSLAAWLSSHLWLLCLAATVLTFRLRKHKLDDYEGEYRLWFWLVFTCAIGSIDSTTRLTDLFGAALDRWSQLHVGWTGGAIVQATLATLIGMLGLRLCSELKTVPTSLVLWLSGLLCWAGSAALSQSLFKLDITFAMRDWMRASLWLSGLTAIWLSGLFYLRAIFLEAQKRFLSRAVLASGNATPWRERIKEAMPKMPSFRKRGELDKADEPNRSAAPRRQKAAATTANAQNAEASSASNSPAAPKRRWGLGGLALRPPAVAGSAASGARTTAPHSAGPNAGQSTASQSAAQPRIRPQQEDDGDNEQQAERRETLSPRSQAAYDAEIQRDFGKRPSWFRRQNRSEEDPNGAESAAGTSPARKSLKSVLSRGEKATNTDAADNSATKRSLRDRLRWKRKENGIDDETKATKKAKQKVAARDEQDGDAKPVKSRGSWLRMPKPKLPKVKLVKPRLPKLKLPSFRLPPPGTQDADQDERDVRVPSTNQSRPLPSTSGPSGSRPNNQNQDQDDNGRGMSKAERKRLKRMQREDDGDRRAA